MGILAREHRRSGGRAGGSPAKAMGKQNALMSQVVEGGRPDHGIAVDARVRPTPVIRQAVENARARVGGLYRKQSSNEDQAREKPGTAQPGAQPRIGSASRLPQYQRYHPSRQ